MIINMGAKHCATERRGAACAATTAGKGQQPKGLQDTEQRDDPHTIQRRTSSSSSGGKGLSLLFLTDGSSEEEKRGGCKDRDLTDEEKDQEAPHIC